MSDEPPDPPRRPRGRPRVEPHTSVSTWIPTTLHDRVTTIARRHDVSVAAVVRIALTKAISRSDFPK